jgi:hypothetical protein
MFDGVIMSIGMDKAMAKNNKEGGDRRGDSRKPYNKKK